jgi:hypothetical protein
MTKAEAKDQAQMEILNSIGTKLGALIEYGDEDYGNNRDTVVAAIRKQGNRVCKMFGYNDWF